MTIHVVGGGLAGLAAALRLAQAGREVTLHEASPEAGGRCRALPDGTDNGTHALTGANTAALAFLDRIKARHRWVEAEPGTLPVFDAADGTVRQVALAPLRWVSGDRPAGLSLAGLLALATGRGTVARAFRGHPVFLRSFVEPLTVAALNTPIDDASLPLLRAVLTRLLGPGAARLLVAERGLGLDLIEPALAALRQAGVSIRFNARLRAIETVGARASALLLGEQRIVLRPTDAVILALPPWETTRLLPGTPAPASHAPIVNLHFARPAETAIRFIGLLGGVAQWMLVRPAGISVTISAADAVVSLGAEALTARVWPELRAAASALALPGPWPEAAPPARVVKERRATPRHGLPANPVPARRPLTNLALAGDWTFRGLPATIEAAIRSGEAAAEALT